MEKLLPGSAWEAILTAASGVNKSILSSLHPCHQDQNVSTCPGCEGVAGNVLTTNKLLHHPTAKLMCYPKIHVGGCGKNSQTLQQINS